MSNELLIWVVVFIIGIFMLSKYYGFFVSIVWSLILFLLNAIIVLVPKYFGYESKYIILGILLIIAVIFNVKKVREYLKKKILKLNNK